MGRSPCCVKEGLKKGPWTQEEDEKLIAFVKDHGHGNWRSLPKKCGLLRCGKSCRLRWTNYLRPDIKRGLFTLTEEQKIIQLHALVGNKWAFIASQLPKRTDNEIKNYWNTVLRKRLEKVGLLSLGTTSTDNTIIPIAAETQRQENKSIMNIGSAGKKLNNSDVQGNIAVSSTHLAQWESARLEAEARLSKESQSSKTQKPFSFKYMGHSFPTSNTTSSAFSSFSNTTTATATTSAFSNTTTSSAFSSLISNNTYTNQQSLKQLLHYLLNAPNTFPSTISNPSSLIHPPSTINSLSITSSLSLPINSLSTTPGLSLPFNSLSPTPGLSLPFNSLSTTPSLSLPAIIASMPSSCSAPSNSSTTSNIVSSKSLSRLSSKESIASALTLGPTGRLSWQAKELSFTTSRPIGSNYQSSFISQMLCKLADRHHGQEVDLHASTKGDLEPGELKAIRGNEQMNLEATSSIMDLNSTIENSMDLNISTMENSMDLNSTMDNWHDLLFDVESSCSDVLSSTQREEFTHDATSHTIKAGTPHIWHLSNVQEHGSLDLEGLNLLQFDSLMACEHYTNQHSKELCWDTPTALSVSSTSIVN